jgi:predicted DNA-binding transcriptional regulator AlpA
MVCSSRITLIHGIHAINVPDNGLTAAELRLAYRDVLNVGPDARLNLGANLIGGRGPINVVYGAHDLDMNLAGLTVEEIQYSLRDVLNVAMTIDAYLDGILIEDKAITVIAGSRLEFLKPEGRKGVGQTWTKAEFMGQFHMDEADWSDWVSKGLPFDMMQGGTAVLNETEVDRWKAAQRGQQPENSVVLERLANAAEEIAKHLDPKPPEIVKSSYVARRFGCSIKWVGEMIRRGEIPKSCIAPGSGSGKQWRFYRSKIDRWIDSKS